MKRMLSVVGVLSALVVMVVAMSAVSAVKAQSPVPPAPKLIASVGGVYEPLEIDNVANEVLVGEVGKLGVLGASLNPKAGFVLDKKDWDRWDMVPPTSSPKSVTSLHKGVVVTEDGGIRFYGRPGVDLIARWKSGREWAVVRSIRPLGGDHIAFLMGQDLFGTFRINLEVGEKPEEANLWYLGSEGSRAKMRALEVIGSTAWLALEDGIILGLDVSSPNNIDILGGFFIKSDEGGWAMPVTHLESVGSKEQGWLVASDGSTRVWVIKPDVVKPEIVYAMTDPDSFENVIRANGSQIVMTGTHGVYVYEVDKWSGKLTEIARIGGTQADIGYYWAEVNRWGLLVTTHINNGLQLWDLGKSAIFPGPTPTPALEPGQIKGVLILPWLSQPTFRWDESMKPFAAARPATHNASLSNLHFQRSTWPGAPTEDFIQFGGNSTR